MSGLLAALLSLLLVAGCAAPPVAFDLGNVPKDAQLALSPSGQQLLVTWRAEEHRTEAKLLTFTGRALTAVRPVAVPEGTFHVAFGRSEDHIIATTLNRQQAGTLLRIDLKSGNRTVLHSSTARMGFPLELGDDHHVFLEVTEPGGRFSQWRRLQGQHKTLLNDKLYGRSGSSLNHAQGAFFLLQPSLEFDVLHGSLPAGVAGLVVPSTFLIRCADNDPLTCVRTHLHFGPTGSSFGTMAIFNGKRRCNVAGQWIDESELRVSRDGSTVVFHAAIGEFGGTRALYRVKNEAGNCKPEQVQLAG